MCGGVDARRINSRIIPDAAGLHLPPNLEHKQRLLHRGATLPQRLGVTGREEGSQLVHVQRDTNTRQQCIQIYADI